MGSPKTPRDEAMNVSPTVALNQIPTNGDNQAFTELGRDENNRTVYTATLMVAGPWMGDVPIQDFQPIV